MTAAEVQAGIETALARIEAAQAALAANRPVDLAGLESDADRLCGVLLRLPAPEAKPFAPRLATMIQALDRLAKALEVAKTAETRPAAPDPRVVARAYGGSRG